MQSLLVACLCTCQCLLLWSAWTSYLYLPTNTVPEHALLVMSRKSDACVLAEGGGTRVAVYGSHAVGALLATKQATFYCGVTQSGGFV